MTETFVFFNTTDMGDEAYMMVESLPIKHYDSTWSADEKALWLFIKVMAVLSILEVTEDGEIRC